MRAKECQNFEAELKQKLKVSLGAQWYQELRAESDWFLQLRRVPPLCKQQAKVALFKTYAGAWTTTHRMHEPSKQQCLFGCKGEKDELRHYLLCPSLWLVVAEDLGTVPPLGVEMRLCMSEVCPQSVSMLALAFQTYHYTKSQLKVSAQGGLVQPSPHFTQTVAQECVRTYRFHYT